MKKVGNILKILVGNHTSQEQQISSPCRRWFFKLDLWKHVAVHLVQCWIQAEGSVTVEDNHN